jgi:hypothetical protein
MSERQFPFRVQIRIGFVEHDEEWIAEQGAGERYALALADNALPSGPTLVS